MSNDSEVVALRRVVHDERIDIARRRRRAGLGDVTPSEVKDQIVGLSVSGGGVRSACFGMGFAQALHACGVWKWIDYLSTVSGGGYLGAYISTATLRDGEQAGRASFPLAERTGHRQPQAALRLIYGGDYLLSAWELANKYLIGLLLINLSIFSALIAIGALFALLWRSFDIHPFRERADMLDLDVDLYAAFWPFIVFLLAWLCSWTLSYYRRGAEAPGTVARGLLYATAGALVIGIALLLGNGDIALPQWLGDPLHGGRGIWSTIVALVLGSLLPLLQPRRLIQSGVNPRHEWERWMFAVVTTAMLAGVPIAIVGSLGRENISGYSDALNRPILRHDIDDPHAFALLFGTPKKAENRSETTDSAKGADARPPTNLLAAVPSGDATIRTVYEASQPPPLETDWADYQKALREFKGADERRVYWADHYRKRTYQLAGLAFPSSEDNRDNEALKYWNAKRTWQADFERTCAIFDEQILPRQDLLAYLSALPITTADKTDEGAKEGKTSEPIARNRAGEALMRRVRTAPESLSTYEVKQANRLLLEQHYPHIFRKRTEIRRAVVINEDQKWRLGIFIIASLVFLCSGGWVDLNATSMHGYYRNRLARAFVVPKNDKSRSVDLSELNTTDYGGPYHLISASAGWFHRQLGTSDSRRSSSAPRVAIAAAAADRLQTPRWVDSFLFSRRFCGCEATGYLATKEYEGRVKGDLNRIDMAEAIALSGGAVSPGHVRNPFIAFLMFGLNLRLGQWLPNPRGAKPVARPTVLQLLWSLRKPPQDRRYCFVSDGGHCENLGLLALLRRRCRLIIAVDAGQDPQHCFDDLAKVLRDARIHDGIDVAPLSRDTADWLDASALSLQKGSSEELPKCQKHFLVARVLYPDGFEGLLIYAKPSMDGDEPIDLLQYRNRNKEFPHESTSDQVFDPAQVESYRQLGYHIGWQIFGRLDQFSSVEELVAAIERSQGSVAGGSAPSPRSATPSAAFAETSPQQATGSGSIDAADRQSSLASRETSVLSHDTVVAAPTTVDGGVQVVIDPKQTADNVETLGSANGSTQPENGEDVPRKPKPK